jgi:hypothetical protein
MPEPIKSRKMGRSGGKFTSQSCDRGGALKVEERDAAL